MRITHWIVVLLSLVILTIVSCGAAGHHSSPRSTYRIDGGPIISNVQANASTVGRYEKFELTFEITGTTATNLQFPYDPEAPAPVPAGVGITVDGLFSNDNWTTTIVQPAFLYQDYHHQTISWAGIEDRDWLYPIGNPVWKIRFAPQETGTWQYRIRATDASGTIMTSPQSFTVIDSLSRGFIRVSQTDPRYFEFSDGTPFIGVGHNEGFDQVRLTSETDQKFQTFATNRVNFFRIWMSGYSIVGFAAAPWYGASLTSEEGYGGQPFSLKLSPQNPCTFQGWLVNVPVKPDTTYRLMVRLKAVDLIGSGDYGFVVKTAGWLDTACANSDNGTLLLSHVAATIGPDGWQEVTNTFETSNDQYFLNNLYLALENVASGVVYVDEVSIREVLEGGYGPEILRKNRFNYHLYFDQVPSWHWDYVLDRAAEQGIYLKLVVLEKDDWIYNRIDWDGNVVTTPAPGNANFYGDPNNPTAVRRLHEYYWRYLAARWGYSTAVHSWELINEGDPYNGNHYDQANSFAAYIHANEPSQHLVTTSHWHSFPILEFWGNPSYPDVDYADLHAYISTPNTPYEWNPPSGTSLETNWNYVMGGEGGSIRVPAGRQSSNGDGYMTIRGEGTWDISVWMKVEDYAGVCPYGMPSNLAGPQLVVWVEGVTWRVIPYKADEPDTYYICTNDLTGTQDWTEFSGIVEIPDDNYRTIGIGFKTNFASTGTAWFDNLEVTSPDGRKLNIFGDGSFDDHTRMDYDAALYTEVYSRLDGAKSLSGAGKPVVRGEAGIDDYADPQGELPELVNDTQGIWLHNYTWGLINPGGMYELYWWPYNIRNYDLYPVYKPFRDFMEGIPLNDGNYVDAEARTSSASLRAWGQKDPIDGKAHLWIQNMDHTWRNVVDGVPMTPLNGTVTLSGFQSGLVEVEWWDTYAGIITNRETIAVGPSGFLALHVSNLETDVACRIVQTATFEWPYHAYLPMIMK